MDALKDMISNNLDGDKKEENKNNNSGGSDLVGGLVKNFMSSGQDGDKKDGKNDLVGGLMNKINSAAGGGPESEKNEDLLDKGVDLVQQYVLKQGDQSNESAAEQAKDEQISDFIRKQYKERTGSDFPIKDKDTKLGL